MMNTFVVYVENKPGVLTRVASLFRRRAFNIDSLTVGRTERPEVSRMTIVVDADRDQALRVEANLYKLVNVLLVENITGKPSICRDLVIVKVPASQTDRSPILQIVHEFRARIVDFDIDSLTIEMTGSEEKIDRLLKVLRPFGILEMVRTGIVGMRRGIRTEAVPSVSAATAAGNGAGTGNGAATIASDDNISYSV
jgi:acetolactate synthase-1/3 small subunit